MKTLVESLNDGTMNSIPFPTQSALQEAFQSMGPSKISTPINQIITGGATASFKCNSEGIAFFDKIYIFDPHNYMGQGFKNSNPINTQMACFLHEMKQAGIDKISTRNSSIRVMDYINECRRTERLAAQGEVTITDHLINKINGKVYYHGHELLIDTSKEV